MAEEKREMTGEERYLTDLRNLVKNVGDQIIKLKEEYKNREDAFPGQAEEMTANVVLAYRHLEDARMRLGKVMQQIQGGVSIFDKQEQGNGAKPVGETTSI